MATRLPYQCDLETLDLSIAQSSVIEKQKLVHMVTALVQESVGIWAGSDADHLIPARQRATETYNQATQPLSDQVQIRIQSSWSKGGNVFIRQNDPLPITVLALVPNATVGGS